MNRLFARLHRKSREKKYQLFSKLLRPTSESRILNVGATGSQIGLPEQFETFYPYCERTAVQQMAPEAAAGSGRQAVLAGC